MIPVALVGAGPGDPDLLTVKAARLLAAAEVVVHDALVGDGVLGLVPPTAELIDVGKRPGRPVPQELISTLLVELARAGRRVVRLKGGDPFVFGRGGEEAQALLDAGIPFEVVPGITSAVAAPAAAGIPVTHRGVAAAFTVVTGHRRAGEPDVDWRSLARVGGTVVVLMGVAQRGAIAAELMAGGLDPATPVAAVRSATTAGQVVTRVPPRRAGGDAGRVAGRDRHRRRRRAGAGRRRRPGHLDHGLSWLQRPRRRRVRRRAAGRCQLDTDERSGASTGRPGQAAVAQRALLELLDEVGGEAGDAGGGEQGHVGGEAADERQRAEAEVDVGAAGEPGAGLGPQVGDDVAAAVGVGQQGDDLEQRRQAGIVALVDLVAVARAAARRPAPAGPRRRRRRPARTRPAGRGPPGRRRRAARPARWPARP